MATMYGWRKFSDIEGIKPKPKKSSRRHWEFKTSHRNLLCLTEVAMFVNRENPIAVIEDAEGVVNTLVHESLLEKAILCDIQLSAEASPFLYPGIYKFYDINLSLKQLISWAKKVKNAPWGNKKDETKFKVTIPKI